MILDISSKLLTKKLQSSIAGNAKLDDHLIMQLLNSIYIYVYIMYYI